MTTYGPVKETMAEAGYYYGGYDNANGGHRLIRVSDGKAELWFANKNHASYGITWRGTDLEFAREVGI